MPRTLPLTLPNLSGRRAIVTGASDGIGFGIAHKLAAAGAEVVLPVRNRRKGEAAVAHIRREHPAAHVSLRNLDLSSLRSVAALGQQLREEGLPVHLLVNNAGVMTPPERQSTAEDSSCSSAPTTSVTLHSSRTCCPCCPPGRPGLPLRSAWRPGTGR